MRTDQEIHLQQAYLNNQQDRQCTYNVTPMRVRAPIVVVEKQQLLHILSARL